MNFDGQPDLSVIIPYFNQPELLAAALEDLLSQKDLNLEVIVVDDASERECEAQIAKFRDMGLDVRLFRQGKRSYTLAGRLLGMRQAKGRWIAFMDSDDRLVSGTVFANAVSAADAAKTQVLHFRAQSVDQQGYISYWPYAAPFYNGTLEGADIFRAWLEADCPAHSVWNKLYSRELCEQVCSCGHELKIFRIEDFYLTAHFLFFAKRYVSSDLLIYKYFLPGGVHLEKAAGRAFDALRMYLHFPARFRAFGLDETLIARLRDYLAAIITINGGRLCRLLPEDVWKQEPFELDFAAPGMQTVMRYGTRRDFLLLLLLANASNARKLRDMNSIINA